ncbi:MAG: hypothetical protein ACLTSG_12830 [Lachnospiraceae bacterium]
MSGIITKVSGPLVVAEGLADANVSDVVRVGSQRLIGEILNMTGDSASIQVYEETSGLGPGAEVVTTGLPLSVELGPGMLENIYDGIQRPLPEIRALTGETISRGVQVAALNREKKWEFNPVAEPGQHVDRGATCSATVQETSCDPAQDQWCPVGCSGTVKIIEKGELHSRPRGRRHRGRQRRQGTSSPSGPELACHVSRGPTMPEVYPWPAR